MRFFFTGPRIFGIRPGVILGASDFRKAFAPSASRSNMTGSFVYVIEGQAGHHKIGVSRDPIQRLSDLQTGSPFPLRFAYIGVTPGTGYNIEGVAHNLLEQHKVLNEWFTVPASIAIGATLEAAMRLGEPIQQVAPEIVPQIVYLANRSGTAAPKGTVKVRDLVMSAVVVGAWIWLAYFLIFIG
jgi:T5orf172 domain